MTAAKIDSMTACRWPGCTSSVHRRGLCARDCFRVKAMVTDGAAHWSDAPAVWATLWEDRTARIKAERVRRSREAAAAAAAPAEPEAVANIAPPKVGHRWGDLTPEQRAMVPVGSEAVFKYGDGERSAAIKVKPSEHGECWAPDSAGAAAVDSDDSLHADRRITRLGPAPTATPEFDRSGWPVLVKRTVGDYEWPTSGRSAILIHGERSYAAWFDEEFRTGGTYSTAALAADAIQARLPEDAAAVTAPELADITERAAALGMPAGLHIGTWWSTQLTEARERAREMEARANEAAAEIDGLREQVEAFRRAACVATGWGESTTPGDATLIQTLRQAVPRELVALRTVVREAMEACDRAGVHEGLTPAERIDVLVCQRNLADHALADARGRLERAHAASRLRAAIADALDIEGPVPPDDELVRRLRELATDGDRDLAVVRDVIGACTGGLRRLAYDSHPPSPVAVDALCTVIERTVGVVRG